MGKLPKKTLDEWLDGVDYSFLNSSEYKPSEFALKFLAIIKLINGKEGESNKTPPVHLVMLDRLATRQSNYVVNCCARGMAKTTLLAEYLVFYIALQGGIPKLDNISVMLYIADSVENGAKSLRKNLEHRYYNSDFLMKYLPKATFTDAAIEFENIDGKKLALKLYGATSGIRGVKVYGKRPQLAIIDDIFTDEAARSKSVRELMKDTIYNGVINALDPTGNLVIYNGTPFNKEDPLVEAIESGEWDVSVYPICEKFPCSKKEFVGAWEDRFSYDVINSKYSFAVGQGKRSSFYQELMLRITSEEDRLVQDHDIKWYKRDQVLNNRQNFNFYITTDFATSSKNTADYSVISVWAYNNNGDWFWVDGICTKQTMDLNIDALFNFVSAYLPQSVGVEVTGQQGAFIQWLQNEMFNRNVYFNLARQVDNKNGSAGIRPTVDKLSRFQLVVPWFKMGKFYFPIELKTTSVMVEFMDEIRLATQSGLKGKDDCLDTISMLAFMQTYKPSSVTPTLVHDPNTNVWERFSEPEDEDSALDSYIV